MPSKKNNTARNHIPICRCKTEARATELADLLNGEGYSMGVTAEEDKVFLHQLEAEAPYSMAMIRRIRTFARAWNNLVNSISV